MLTVLWDSAAPELLKLVKNLVSLRLGQVEQLSVLPLQSQDLQAWQRRLEESNLKRLQQAVLKLICH